jgi:hypothetical protein
MQTKNSVRVVFGLHLRRTVHVDLDVPDRVGHDSSRMVVPVHGRMTQLRVATAADVERLVAWHVVVGPDGAASGLVGRRNVVRVGVPVLGIRHRRAFDFVVAVVRPRVFHILF